MAKVVSVPKDEIAKWTERVTCGNPFCRAVLEVTAADLFLSVAGVSASDNRSGEVAFRYWITVTCPVCHHPWFLSASDQDKVPASIVRRSPKKSMTRQPRSGEGNA